MIRRLLICLMFPVTLWGAIENMRIDTKTHQVQPPTPSGTALFDFQFGTLSTDITGGGGGTPGGLTGQLQYKSGASAFGGIPSLTYDGGTTQVTLVAGTKLILADSTDATKKLQLTLSGITTGSTRNFTIPNSDFTGIVPATAPSNQFQTGVNSGGNPTFAQPTDANLSTSDVTTNNASITKHGFMSKLPNDATKYADGVGGFSVPPGAGGAPGGTTTQLQRNNAGAFGGISTLTSDGTIVTQKAGTNYVMADPTDATKKTDFSVANVSTGQTRHVTFPNIDSVTVGPLTAIASNWVRYIDSSGVQNRSQPAFTDISGSIGTGQNNIPSGKTNYVDFANGNNTTALPGRFDRPYKTLNGGTGAIANTSAGDEINVGPGSFAESGAVVLPANVSFVGAGAGVTTIVTTGGVKPGTGDKIAGMTIDARTGTNASSSFAIGADTADTAFTDVTIAGVELLGNTDGFFFNKAGIDRVAIYDSTVTTTLEAAFTGATTGEIIYYNCNMSVDGSIGGASIVYGYNATSGLTTVYGGTITLRNGVLEARSLRASGILVTLSPHSVTSDIIATTKYDIHQSSNATVYNDSVVRKDGTTLLTSGTITQIINSYEGNLGLTDLTINNATTSRHGFMPKLPNDATKYADGVGGFSVPAGGGGGGGAPIIQNVGDADATITGGANVINLTTALTASRVLTLPAASTYSTSPAIVVIDPRKVLSGAFTISVARAGSDTINGGTGNVALMGVNETGGSATIYSDGTAKWTTAARGGASRVAGYVDGTPTSVNDVLTWNGIKWAGASPVVASISDTVYDSTAWNGITTIGASKNALRDYFVLFDTDGNGKVNVLDQAAGIPVTDATGLITSTKTAPSGTIVGTTDTQTITAKRITNRVTSNASVSSPTASATTDDIYELTAQAANPAFQLIAGSPTNGQEMWIRVMDNGTPRTITWDTSFDFSLYPAPTTTVASTWLILGFRYSTTTSKWICFSNSQLTAVTSPITNTAGTIGLNVGVDHAFTAAQNITLNLPTTNGVTNALGITTNSTGTPANGLGTGIIFNSESSTTTSTNQGSIQTAWSDVTDATKTSYMDFMVRTGGGSLTSGIRLFGSRGVSVNNTTDPGAGFVNVPTAGGYKINNVDIKSDTQTLSNKRTVPRITTISSSATPTINTDNCDAVTITAQAAAITSMTTNLSGTPNNFDKLIIRIKDNGTARAITWGASFEAKGTALPTTTVISKVLTVAFIWDSVTSKWGCVASAQEA